MHSHKLILEKDRSKAEWLLEWDEAIFRLKFPDGETAFEEPTSQAHQLFDTHKLYLDRKAGFRTADGALTFRINKSAAKELRRFFEDGLRSDLDFRLRLKRQARKLMMRGTGMLILGGTPFGLFWWFAFTSTKPPPAWISWAGSFIHVALLVLISLALAGAVLACFSFWQLIQIRRIEGSPSRISTGLN